MKSLGALAVLCLAACGDNSKQCGPGTTENQGVCEPTGSGGLICGDGTVLDELTSECVPDPSVCGGGTVLINGECKDPSDGLAIDVEEGAEPNGFEADSTPAGILSIKPIGEPLVIKGCIAPIDNSTPDFDVYDFDVDGATLLHITADGVQGLAAGFFIDGDSPALRGWTRLGLNISTDTSKREVYLPVAGHYRLVMTDTRTLLPLTNNGEGLPAAGNPDGTSCYFVTVNRRAIPSAAALDLSAPNTGVIGEDLKFFTASFQSGINTMFAVIDPEDADGDGTPDLDQFGNPIDSHAASSIVLVNNDRLRQINDADATSPISSALFGGIKAGDVPLVVLDYVWNYAINPAPYAIEMLDQTSSQPLGATVNATSNGQFFAQDGESFFENVNLFHFDVTDAGEIDKLNFSFSISVQGSIVDEDGGFVSPLTGVATPVVETFTDYKGLLRPFAPGRHYLFVFAPRDPVGTSFTVTGSLVPLTPTPLGVNPSAPTAFNDVKSNLFRQAAGTTVPWRSFNATADSTVGALDVSVFDPDVFVPQTPGFGFGRLDPMITQLGAAVPAPKAGDGTPLFHPTFETDGSTPQFAILRNQFAALPPAATTFLVKVNPTVPNPTGNFVLAFGEREFNDYGTIAAGQSTSFPFTMTAGNEERFFVQTTPGHQVTITVTPDAAPTLDPVVELLNVDETVFDSFSAATGNPVVVDQTQNLSGFLAFRVAGAANDSGNYTVEIAVTADPAGYSVAQAAAGFSNACLGGSAVPLLDDGGGFGGDDDGLSAVIAAPAGFAVFGEPASSLRVSSNGFLSTDVNIAAANGLNSATSSDSAVSIAPNWDELGGISVCKKTVNGALVVQWDGFSFDTGQNVQFQAILDGNGTIQFVYGPLHTDNGSSATIGVQGGGQSLDVSVDTAVEVPASSITLTPN